MSGRAYIGTSGFMYDHWRGVFYPPEVEQPRWLEYYSQAFDTVEINTTYYHMPRGRVCAKWAERSPEGFRFVVKMNGLVTHRRQLAGCQDPLAEFIGAVEALGDKLGPILVQLPPGFEAHPRRLSGFLGICPDRHRWALEFRHPSWFCPQVYEVLRARKAALVIHDMIPAHPWVFTADWTYIRFHGPGRGHGQSYSEEMLDEAAQRVRESTGSGLDVYAFFNNDAQGYALMNARRLGELVSESSLETGGSAEES